LETKITPELTEEWWARELIAAVNGLRGDRSLAYEARIRLSVWCGKELRAAIEKNQSYVAGETLASEVAFHDLAKEGGALEGNAGEQAYRIDFTTE
jgi:isoleucyl-tRNA synthetase